MRSNLATASAPMAATVELTDAEKAVLLALLKHEIAADPFPLSRRFDLLLYLDGDFVVVARHGFELLAQCGVGF
jgi:hypothetical protein